MEDSKLMSPASTNTRWEKFTHALLATTCLSVVAGGSASASTILIVEGTSPAPANFPGTAPGYLLPVGTNLVQGQLHGDTDDDDFFEFQGLYPGRSFVIEGTYNPLGQERQVSFQAFNTNGNSLGIASLEGEGGIVSGTIPGDGELIVDVSFSSQGNPTYQISLGAELAILPEPSTFATAGAGLAIAGALAWRRKRSAKA